MKIGDEVTLQLQVRANLNWDERVELAVYRLEEILKIKRTVTITLTQPLKKFGGLRKGK